MFYTAAGYVYLEMCLVLFQAFLLLETLMILRIGVRPKPISWNLLCTATLFLQLKPLTQIQVKIAKKFIGYHPIVIICLTRAGFKKENAIVH